MKRILITAMQQKDGLYWYQDELFTGIGFEIGQNDVVRGYEMEQGRICSSYVPICRHEHNNDATMEVDLSGNLASYEEQTYQGQPYTGIGYTFNNERCSREKFFRDGFQEAGADWSESGFLKSIGISTGIFGEDAEWYSSNQLKYAGISTGPYYSGSLAFAEDGKLRILTAVDGFIGTLPSISAETRYFPIKTFNELKQYQCAEEIYISGNDINDMLISDMSASGMFKETKKLELARTSIKNPSFFYTELAPGLREVLIENDDPLNVAVARHIKLHRPELRVVFNRVEVELPTI